MPGGNDLGGGGGKWETLGCVLKGEPVGFGASGGSCGQELGHAGQVASSEPGIVAFSAFSRASPAQRLWTSYGPCQPAVFPLDFSSLYAGTRLGTTFLKTPPIDLFSCFVWIFFFF